MRRCYLCIYGAGLDAGAVEAGLREDEDRELEEIEDAQGEGETRGAKRIGFGPCFRRQELRLC
jgi:hypothetical protein